MNFLNNIINKKGFITETLCGIVLCLVTPRGLEPRTY